MIVTCMNPGVKMNCADAASIPATADKMAAKPQPIESIHGTRTPSSLLAEGSTADARSARPSFVYLKSSHSNVTHTSTTMRSYTDCCGIATLPIDHVPPASGDRRIFSSGCQIQLTMPFRMTSKAIVAITTVNSPARWSGRITVSWMAKPPRNETPRVNTNAGQYDQPWCAINAYAM